MVKQVTLYEAEDGTRWGTEQEAHKHEKEVRKAEKVDTLVSNFYFHGLSRTDIVEGILSNAKELKKLL